MRNEPFDIDLSQGFNKGSARIVENQERINLYLKILKQPAISPVALVSIRGIVEVANAGTYSYFARGVIVASGVPYVVLGAGLYWMDADYELNYVGVIPGINQVSMAFNGTQILILEPGAGGYIYNLTLNTLVDINDADFRANGNPQYVVFIDGYFVCNTDSKKFICSALNDGTNWAALDFGSAESDPDITVSPSVNSNALVIWGSETGEQFQNIGGAGFPFQRTGFVIPKGVSAPLSIVTADNKTFFVGKGKQESPSIWVASVNGYEKVATSVIDEKIQRLNLAQVEAIRAWTYAEDGQTFVGFNLPDTTLVYEMTTGLWDERKSYIDGELTTWRVHSVFPAYGKMFVTDTVDGKIGMFSDDVHTEYGNRIIKRIVLSPFTANTFAFSIPMIEMTLQSGMLEQDAPDETIDFETSRDCFTWNNLRPRSVGKIGEYGKRVIWTRNGMFPSRSVWRFTTSVDAKVVIAKLSGTITRADK